MDNCIFCQLANKSIPTEIVYESKLVLAFKDANPVADTHLLIIPKAHYTDILEMAHADNSAELSAALTLAVKEICQDLGLTSFHLLNNCGAKHGQSVFHVHFHLISGVDLTKTISQ